MDVPALTRRAALAVTSLATAAAWPVTRQDRRPGTIAPPVLCYHRFLEPTSAPDRPRYSVTPEQLRTHLDVLEQEGFVAVDLARYRAAVQGAETLPERSVLITVDDGFADTAVVAWPILREREVPLTVFVCTGLLQPEGIEAFAPHRDTPAEAESRRTAPDLWAPLSTGQITQLQDEGVAFGFHSHSHRNMGAMTPDEVAADIDVGLASYRERIGERPTAFAFPYGHPGAVPDHAVHRLREQGIDLLFSTDLARTQLPTDDPVLARIVVHPEDTATILRRKLLGGYDWVGAVRRWVYARRG